MRFRATWSVEITWFPSWCIYVSVTFQGWLLLLYRQNCFTSPHMCATFTWITAPCFRDLHIGCCGFKPSKELLLVSRVGVDNDFFNITTLGVPWVECNASVGLHDTDLVKRWVCFLAMCSSDDLKVSFCLINWAAHAADCTAWGFFIPKSSRRAFLKRWSL